MHAFRRFIRVFFGFSRRETNGFFVLVPVIFIILFSRPIYNWLRPAPEADFSREKAALDSLIAVMENKKISNEEYRSEEGDPVRRAFPFDPNSATADQLKLLGFDQNIATRIVRYRERGGRFDIKSDLLRIYGIDSLFYRDLYAYINLPEVKPEIIVVRESDEKLIFDLNLADTTQLIRINGIGAVLSRRIIKYREKLGGFVNRNQLHEVYGLDSIVVSKLQERSFITSAYEPVRLDLNTATEEQLSGHPYISKSLAKAIVTYRFQHGPFLNTRDIQKIHLVDDTIREKMEPYLTVN